MPAPHLVCQLQGLSAAAPVVQAGLRHSADPAVPRRATAAQALPAVQVVRRPVTSAVPAAPADRVVRHPATSAAPAVPADPADRVVPRPVTSAAPADRVVPRPVTSAAPAVRAGPTSADPTITIGGHRGTQATTTGGAGSTAPRGAMICRRGAGVRHRRRPGMVRCRKRGDLRRLRSTTGASRSNPSGIRDTTSGASGSSGSGFRSRSDLRQDGRLACAGRSSARSIHLGEWRIGRCLSLPTKIVAMCCGSLVIRSTPVGLPAAPSDRSKTQQNLAKPVYGLRICQELGSRCRWPSSTLLLST